MTTTPYIVSITLPDCANVTDRESNETHPWIKVTLVYRRVRGDMIKVYKFCHGLYTVDCGILVTANSSITRGDNLKLSRLSCRSRIRHDYFSQRIVEYWNGLPCAVVNASSVNSFKGRLDKHWKEYMFTLELPPRTVTSCH